MWNSSSSRTFYFPHGCSRCEAARDTIPLQRQWTWVERSGRIQTTTTLTLNVPVCHDCKDYVESAETWSVTGSTIFAVAGAALSVGAFLLSGPKEIFPAFLMAGAWAVVGVLVYNWLYGVLGLSFVRPVDKGDYLRFASGEYQQRFDKANPAASRRPEGYLTQYFLYLVYLAAAVYVPFFGIFFWLATFRDHRRLVMKWLVLGISLACTTFLFLRIQYGQDWWTPWWPK